MLVWVLSFIGIALSSSPIEPRLPHLHCPNSEAEHVAPVDIHTLTLQPATQISTDSLITHTNITNDFILSPSLADQDKASLREINTYIYVYTIQITPVSGFDAKSAL